MNHKIFQAIRDKRSLLVKETIGRRIVILIGETNYEKHDEPNDRHPVAQHHHRTQKIRHPLRHRRPDEIYQGTAMTQDELIAVISDVTTLLGSALAQHVDLTETISTQQGAGVESQRLKLDALKARLADEKLKLAKLKDAADRKRELEKLRHDNDRSAARPTTNESKNTGMVTLRATSGKIVGYSRTTGKNQTDFYDRTGKLVAREVGNFTYSNGKAVYRGNLGLLVLGQWTD